MNESVVKLTEAGISPSGPYLTFVKSFHHSLVLQGRLIVDQYLDRFPLSVEDVAQGSMQRLHSQRIREL